MDFTAALVIVSVGNSRPQPAVLVLARSVIDLDIQTLYGQFEMKTRTLNISLPDGLIKALDRRAEAETRSRSEVIRAAALSYLQWWEEWRKLQTYGRKQAKKRKIRPHAVERLIDQLRSERPSRG